MLLLLPSTLYFSFAIFVAVRAAAQRGPIHPVNTKCQIARSIVISIRVHVCAVSWHSSLPGCDLGSESGRRGEACHNYRYSTRRKQIACFLKRREPNTDQGVLLDDTL
jgi:hypothetical protein